MPKRSRLSGKKKMRKIKLFRIHADDGLEFWSALRKVDSDEKLVKTKTFPFPLKEGFYGRDFVSGTDVDSVVEELRQNPQLKKVLVK